MVASVEAARPSPVSDRWLFAGLGLAVAALVFFGFRPTYFERSAELAPLSPLLAIHALVFTAWVGLFLSQVMLVGIGRVTWHRALGLVGVALAAAMVVLGAMAAVDALRRHAGPAGIDPFAFFAIPVTDIVVFALLAGAAVHWRRRPDAHKRLMLLALISLTTPALARISLHFGWPLWAMYPLANLFLPVVFAYDLATRRQVHPASLWGAAAVAAKPTGYLIGPTGVWLALAHALAP